MIKCNKCHSILDDDSKFCGVCGTSISNSMQPKSGQSVQNMDTPTINPISFQNPETANSKSRTNKTSKAFIAASIVMFIIAAVLLLSVVLINVMPKLLNKNDTKKQYAFYLKDNALYSADGKKVSDEITSKYYANDSDYYVYMDGLYRNGNKILYSDKNEYSFDIGNFEGNLNEVDLNNSDNKNKIDSNVNYASLMINKQQNKYLYNKEGTWYIYDSKKQEKEKVAAAQFGNISVSEDLNNYIYLDDEFRLYVKYGKEDKIKIADDVTVFYIVSKNFNKNSTIFYVQYDEDTYEYSLWNYKKGTKKELIEGGTISAMLYDSGEAYFWVNNAKDAEEDIYYYDGESCTYVATASYLGYSVISHYILRDEESAPRMIYKDEDNEYHLLVEKKDVLLTGIEDDYVIDYVDFSKDGSRFLVQTFKYSEKPNYTANVYSIEKNGSEIKAKLEKSIYDLGLSYFTSDGKLVYIQDYDRKELSGSLYLDDTFISSDVYSIMLGSKKNSENIYYMTDLNTSDYGYSLNVYSNKKKKMVSSDVYYAVCANDGSIYYMYDYSDKHNCGEMYYYNGSKPVKIDSEVNYFVITSE